VLTLSKYLTNKLLPHEKYSQMTLEQAANRIKNKISGYSILENVIFNNYVY